MLWHAIHWKVRERWSILWAVWELGMCSPHPLLLCWVLPNSYEVSCLQINEIKMAGFVHKHRDICLLTIKYLVSIEQVKTRSQRGEIGNRSSNCNFHYLSIACSPGMIWFPAARDEHYWKEFIGRCVHVFPKVDSSGQK